MVSVELLKTVVYNSEGSPQSVDHYAMVVWLFSFAVFSLPHEHWALLCENSLKNCHSVLHCNSKLLQNRDKRGDPLVYLGN